jgi:poly-gamma-glutamate capsule biosynthesis protein CapA/YwtB (metallophosphatase superfamily)
MTLQERSKAVQHIVDLKDDVKTIEKEIKEKEKTLKKEISDLGFTTVKIVAHHDISNNEDIAYAVNQLADSAKEIEDLANEIVHLKQDLREVKHDIEHTNISLNVTTVKIVATATIDVPTDRVEKFNTDNHVEIYITDQINYHDEPSVHGANFTVEVVS